MLTSAMRKPFLQCHGFTAFLLPVNLGRSAIRPRKAPSHHSCRSKPCNLPYMSFTAPAKTPAKLQGPDWLASEINSFHADELSILDIRGRVLKPGGRVSSGLQPFEYIADDEAYFGGHIPGAAFVDWRKIDIARHHELCDMLSLLGVERHRPICVYDWGDMLFATRLWYALCAIGCQNVTMLDGGWKAWDAYDGPVSVETMCPLKSYSELESTYDEKHVPRETVPLHEMKGIVENMNAGERDVIIIDARSKRQFAGEEHRAKRAGHLPGAINVPYRTLLNENGIGFLGDEQLCAVFQQRGLLDGNESEYVVYCNGGVSSTVVIFALVRCGVSYERIRNYCGSFGEWGNLDDTPLTVDT